MDWFANQNIGQINNGKLLSHGSKLLGKEKLQISFTGNDGSCNQEGGQEGGSTLPNCLQTLIANYFHKIAHLRILQF